jgi:hypothetical protein
MRVSGEWLQCEDGIVRPAVQGAVQLPGDEWLELYFLLDGGADRTVFSERLLRRLRPLSTVEAEAIMLSGVGGAAGSITVKTAIRFVRDDGRMITVRGIFGVFAESESGELSVLGRDVTNNFSVIYDHPDQAVALLASPHYYEIKRAS